jgi:hypothetical protein
MPWNQPLKKKIEPKKFHSIKPLFILTGCIVIGMSVFFLLNSSTENIEAVPQKSITTKITPKSKTKKTSKTNTFTRTTTNIAHVVSEKPKEMWMGHEIKSTTVKTNGTDLIITRIDINGKKHKEYTSIQKRLFTNPVDIVLAILLTVPEGALTPPLPSLGPRSDELFISALKKPIQITEEDTAETKRIKELVIAAREHMLEELKAGRTVNEVIEEHCIYTDQNNRLRAEAMVKYKELIANGEEDAAEEFRQKANDLISSKGGTPFRSLKEIRESRKSKFRKSK